MMARKPGRSPNGHTTKGHRVSRNQAGTGSYPTATNVSPLKTDRNSQTPGPLGTKLEAPGSWASKYANNERLDRGAPGVFSSGQAPPISGGKSSTRPPNYKPSDARWAKAYKEPGFGGPKKIDKNAAKPDDSKTSANLSNSTSAKSIKVAPEMHEVSSKANLSHSPHKKIVDRNANSPMVGGSVKVPNEGNFPDKGTNND